MSHICEEQTSPTKSCNYNDHQPAAQTLVITIIVYQNSNL